jgi:hypothetical protein
MTIHLLGGIHTVQDQYLVWSRYKSASLPDLELIADLPNGVSQIAHWIIKRIAK